MQGHTLQIWPRFESLVDISSQLKIINVGRASNPAYLLVIELESLAWARFQSALTCVQILENNCGLFYQTRRAYLDNQNISHGLETDGRCFIDWNMINFEEKGFPYSNSSPR